MSNGPFYYLQCQFQNSHNVVSLDPVLLLPEHYLQ